MTEPATSAPIHGPRWGARAADWAELCAGLSQPAWRAIADATGIASGMRVLDVGCGSGEFCALAGGRGATVSGIDAAEALIEIARHRTPQADLHVGAMEHLPWEDATFDVVTGFNSFQFAADIRAALAEARRVTRPGGRVAVCNWSQPQDSDLFTVYGALHDLQPPPPAGSPAAAPPIGEPGVLDQLAREIGLKPRVSGKIDAPWHVRDRPTLERALLAPGSAAPAIDHVGDRLVLTTLLEAAARFRRPDGAYRFENCFTYLIAIPPAASADRAKEHLRCESAGYCRQGT